MTLNIRELARKVEEIEATLGSERLQRALRLADALESAEPAQLDQVARVLVALEHTEQGQRGRPGLAARKRPHVGRVRYA